MSDWKRKWPMDEDTQSDAGTEDPEDLESEFGDDLEDLVEELRELNAQLKELVQLLKPNILTKQ